ncbi:MAG: hypothetical protein PF450_12940 [Bacteroidales bacterium]|nr:hypothetical protein [Bacteroidales bacterium]
MLKIVAMLLIVLGCSTEKTKDKKEVPSELQNPQKSNTFQNASPIEEQEQVDRTDEIYLEIKDLFSGSWMDDSDVVDGEREVSWGIVPFSNQYYFIIDFQNGKKEIIDGSAEGGGLGFDRFIAEVIKIESIESEVYRFTYRNTISTRNSRKNYFITLKYNPDKDTLAILEYYGVSIDNPREMIRISDPIAP